MRTSSKQKGLLEQIAQGATNDQAIITVTSGKGKLLLPVEGKFNLKGDYAYVNLPAVQGFYKKGADGTLAKATPGAEEEALFFPEREAELKARAAELATLKELARKHGFTLSSAEGTTVTRTRAPRGTGKPKAEPKPMPKKGDKFTSTQNGLVYTVLNVDGKVLDMKGEDGSTKSVTYSGIFWRWHTKA